MAAFRVILKEHPTNILPASRLADAPAMKAYREADTMLYCVEW